MFLPTSPVNTGSFWPYWIYDYKCLTQCWAIFPSTGLNLYADNFSDGIPVVNRIVAKIPFYQHHACLVELRQSSLTPSGYRFFKDLQDQTQNNGGVADPPSTASIGNVQNLVNPKELVVGFFTASGVVTVRYWLDRKDAHGAPPGLFMAMTGREPNPEPLPHEGTFVQILDKNTSRSRPYTAVCLDTEKQTSAMPEGWRE